MPVVGDVCFATGSYKDRNGEDKTSFCKIGILFRSEKGAFSIHLDAVPVGLLHGAREGETGVWLRVFEKRERDEGPF